MIPKENSSLHEYRLEVRKIKKSGSLGELVVRYVWATTFRKADTKFKKAHPDYFIEKITPEDPAVVIKRGGNQILIERR